MRTVLLNLPWRQNNRLGVRAGSRWPFTTKSEEDGYIKYIPFPFFLAYSASLLKSKNKNAKLIDAIASAKDEETLMREINAYNPNLVVIETSTPSFDNDIKLAGQIKLEISEAQIVLCGPHASTFAEEILKAYDFIDYVLTGEYEYTLLELVEKLGKLKGLEAVLGLAYREKNKIVINKPRPTINRLDDLPWPEREDATICKYNDGFAGLPLPNVQIWSSRGCPFKCIFCLWPQALYREHKYRKRGAKDVVSEMEWLTKRFGFKAVYFDDDVFNVDKIHCLAICDEINKRKLKIPWAIMARADLMDEGILSSMAGAGLYAVKYGVESACQNVLELCNKKMDFAYAEKMISYTKKLGIKVHLTFCLGLPGETRQSIQETINFISEIKPDSLQFSLATPFPGTEYFKLAKNKGWLLSEYWPDYDGNQKCIIRTESLSRDDLEKVLLSIRTMIPQG